VVDEYQLLFFTEQQQFRQILMDMQTAIGEFNTDGVPDQLGELHNAMSMYLQLHQIDPNTDRTAESKSAFDQQREALQAKVHDLRTLEFIARRYEEGGPALLAAYDEVLADLIERTAN